MSDGSKGRRRCAPGASARHRVVEPSETAARDARAYLDAMGIARSEVTTSGVQSYVCGCNTGVYSLQPCQRHEKALRG